MNHTLLPVFRYGRLVDYVLIDIEERGDGKVTHHVDEDKLDNRRENLQVFDSKIEANCAPHPRRDNYLNRNSFPPHFRETLIADLAEVAA